MPISMRRAAGQGIAAGHAGATQTWSLRPSRSKPVTPAGPTSELPAVATRPGEVVDRALLLNAFKERLRSSAVELPAMLDCVHDLERLQALLAQDLGRCRQLESDLFDARSALARARAELAGSQARERQARHLARQDGLTLLPNRSHFRERLDGVLGRAGPLRQPLAVLYLDLDDFKSINDRHGHDAGDELLRIVAARLSCAVRAGDLVSRLGGDEFACLLADLPGRQQLCHLACKLFDVVSAPVQSGKLELTVRPSIGIAICPADGATTDALLKSADAAMYTAKRARSGYAFFSPVNGV